MPSYSKKFESVLSNSGWDGASNIIEGGTGTCTAGFNGLILVLDAGYDSNSFPANATFTGIRIAVTTSTSNSNASTLKITPQIGANSGTVTTINPNVGFTALIGNSSNLLGLTLNTAALPYLRVKYTLTIANSTTTTISFTNIQIYYTLPFSNKLYNTGGKLSITSGKVSLT